MWVKYKDTLLNTDKFASIELNPMNVLSITFEASNEYLISLSFNSEEKAIEALKKIEDYLFNGYALCDLD